MSKKIIPLEDLSFFKAGGLFAKPLPEDNVAGTTSFLTLVTSTMDTSPFWLIRTLLASCLSPESRPETGPHVVLVSCTDRKSMYTKSLQRQRILLSREPRFSYVDLSQLLSFPSINTSNKNDNSLVDQVFSKIQASIPSEKSETSDSVILFESPDFLLPFIVDNASDPTPPTTQLLNLFLRLQRLSTNLYAFVSSDSPLFNSPPLPNLLDRTTSVMSGFTNAHGSNSGFTIGAGTGNPAHIYENRHTAFVLGLAHRAVALISIRPLSTGRADDVTGTLTIARGPKDLGKVEPESYQYHVAGDVVKIFYK